MNSSLRYTRQKYILFFLLIVSVAACQREVISWQAINTEIAEKFSDVEHISIEQFLEKQEKDDDLLIVDVREPEEYAVSYILGAQNMTDPQVIGKLALESEKDVVVYCSVGYRSALMVQKLQNLGVGEVSSLRGSIFCLGQSGFTTC